MNGLRPLGVGELLDAAVKIYQGRFRTLIVAVAVPVIPVIVLSTVLTISAQPDVTTDPSTGLTTVDSGDLGLTLVAALISAVAIVIATTIATAACFRSISGAYVGDDPSWRETLRFGFSRFWSVLGLTLLSSLATVLGLLFCLVGALAPMTWYAVAMPALLLEGRRAANAMGRSRDLVRGLGWRTLGIVLLSLVLATAFQAMLSAPLAIVVLSDVDEWVGQLLNGAVQIVTTVLVTPFTAALTTALYVDLRVRKEGFDLMLWAQRMGTDPTGGFPAQPGASTGWPVPVGGFPGHDLVHPVAPPGTGYAAGAATAYPQQPYPPQADGQPYPPQPYPQQPYPQQPYPPQPYPPQADGQPYPVSAYGQPYPQGAYPPSAPPADPTRPYGHLPPPPPPSAAPPAPPPAAASATATPPTAAPHAVEATRWDPGERWTPPEPWRADPEDADRDPSPWSPPDDAGDPAR